MTFTSLLSSDLRGNSFTLYCLTQKGFGGVYVALPAQLEIDRLTSLVDRPIQIHPFPLDSDVRLIHPPGAAD